MPPVTAQGLMAAATQVQEHHNSQQPVSSEGSIKSNTTPAQELGHDCAVTSGSEDEKVAKRRLEADYHAVTNPATWKIHPPRTVLPQDQKEAILGLLDKADDQSKVKYKTSLLHLVNQYAVSQGDLEKIIREFYSLESGQIYGACANKHSTQAEKISNPNSLSTAKYTDLAPPFRLNPSQKSSDISKLAVYRSRLPPAVINLILSAVDTADIIYGRMSEHKTERVRGRYVESVRIYYARYGDRD